MHRRPIVTVEHSLMYIVDSPAPLYAVTALTSAYGENMPPLQAMLRIASRGITKGDLIETQYTIVLVTKMYKLHSNNDTLFESVDRCIYVRIRLAEHNNIYYPSIIICTKL